MVPIIISILLFLTPFVIAPFGITQFEVPKIVFVEAGVILLLITTLSKKISFSKNRFQLIVYGFVFLLTVFDLLFYRTSISLLGNNFRMQGIFLLWSLLLFSYISSKFSIQKIPWWVFAILVTGQTILTLFLPLNENNRNVGTLGEPNALGAFMIFLWPFLWFATKKLSRIKILILIVAMFATLFEIVVSGSRSAVIGFIIQIIFILLNLIRGLNPKKIAVLCLFLVFLSWFTVIMQKDILYENRFEVWQTAFVAGLNNPLLGGGFGNLELLLHNAAQQNNLAIQYSYVDSSHNLFLDWWVQAGLIGLFILCLLIFVSFKNFVKDGNQKNIVILLGLLTALSFNPASVVGLLGFWWLIGQGMKDQESLHP